MAAVKNTFRIRDIHDGMRHRDIRCRRVASNLDLDDMLALPGKPPDWNPTVSRYDAGQFTGHLHREGHRADLVLFVRA